MSKPAFTMIVGIVGSGKSTYAKQLAEEINAIICSSDAIREELCGDENSQDNNDEVFKILHSKTKFMLSIRIPIEMYLDLINGIVNFH